MTNQQQASKDKRTFLPKDYELTTWASVEPFYTQLLAEIPQNTEQFIAWMKKVDELSCMLSEDIAWRYIHMTCDTNSKEISEKYQYFVTEISPNATEYGQKLLEKYYQSPFRKDLDAVKYLTYDRAVSNEIELFRPENVAIASELALLSQEYDALVANLTIEENGEKITLQKAASYLESTDRALRERIWRKMQTVRKEIETTIDELFSQMVEKRHLMAKNAGFQSFTQFMFRKLGRFDYTPQDCEKFHEGIKQFITPIYIKLQHFRKQKLGLQSLKPWDNSVDLSGKEPLKPFHGEQELISKTIDVLTKLKPELGQMIAKMNEMKHLDLESRMGKAPGGYNYPLSETGVPFIFMNAVGTQSDLVTMVHEAGHAIHSFVTQHFEFSPFKDTPSEVAELASMSMELLSMTHWDVFYSADDLQRAKFDQIMRTLLLLPWIATVDAFQAWIYDHPHVSANERKEAWSKLYMEYHGHETDWEGLDEFLAILWQKQGHIFDVPFYYIEYGMAQLGALQVWRNYMNDHKKGLEDYLTALKLGYSKTIPQIYQAANISFSWTPEMLNGLSDFVWNELQKLEPELL